MQEIIKNKFYEYIRQNNPDLLMSLQETGNVTQYMTERMESIEDLLEKLLAANVARYIIEEECLQFLIKDLKPSKFNYVRAILEEDFETTYVLLQQSGTLVYETINLIDYCKPVFESLVFTERNEDQMQLRYAIIGTVSEYLQMNQ